MPSQDDLERMVPRLFGEDEKPATATLQKLMEKPEGNLQGEVLNVRQATQADRAAREASLLAQERIMAAVSNGPIHPTPYDVIMHDDSLLHQQIATARKMLDQADVPSEGRMLPPGLSDPTLQSLKASAEVAPVPMLLRCPVCSEQHVDAADKVTGWTNSHHRTHLCAFCGHKWKPFEYCTTGVTVDYFKNMRAEMTEDDAQEMMNMAGTILKNDTDATKQRVIDSLQAGGFVKIGAQMNLYAAFGREMADDFDHFRLWYVNAKGEMEQGDTIRWDTFLESLFKQLKLTEVQINTLINVIVIQMKEANGQTATNADLNLG